MTLTVRPAKFLRGAVHLPSSKSYSIRAFLIAACGGVSRIIDPSDCDDARIAIVASRKLGARVKRYPKNVWQVNASLKKIKSSVINVGESGTVLRLILPLLALKAEKIKVIGEGTLLPRPNSFLLGTLRKMGAKIKGRGKKESVPIIFKGGILRGGAITIDGTLSSQFISALLAAAPQLGQDTRLTVTGKKMVSETYITMTEEILKKAGIKIKKAGRRVFLIKGNQKFRGLKNFTVPSDYGLAAFFLAAAALVPSNLVLRGFLTDNLIQSDGKILDFLRRMGVKFRKTEKEISVRGPFVLKGGNFSLKDCPDLVPIMSVVALFAKGKTRLYDIGHARAKESDRLSDLRGELLKIGVDIKEGKSEIVISPRLSYRKNTLLDPHHDHRLAMSFAVLGLKLGARIKDMECVSKSYPQFVRDLKKIGARAF